MGRGKFKGKPTGRRQFSTPEEIVNYERAAEYFLFSRGIELLYTTVRNLKDDLVRYQPPYIVSVPLVYETLYSGIQKQIDRNSTARKLVSRVLIRVSLAYMELKRIYEGKCLTRNREQPSHLVSLLDWLWARTFVAILWPLHMLAKKLVYSKIKSAIGMSKMLFSFGIIAKIRDTFAMSCCVLQ